MNKKSTLYIFIISCILLITGCNQNDHRKSECTSEMYFDISDWDLNTKIPDKVIKKINFIPLETNDECLIGKINKIIHSKEKIYVLDKTYVKKILVFTKNGEYLYSIGKYGKGKGEYIHISDFLVDTNEQKVFILDNQLNKTIIYNLSDGEVINEIKLDFWASDFAMLNNNTLAFFLKNMYKDKPKGHSIVYMDLNNFKKRTFLKKDLFDVNISFNQSLYQSNYVYYTPYIKNIVYKLTDNEVSSSIVFDYGNSKITQEIIDKGRKSGDLGIVKLIRGGNWSYGIHNVFENDHFLTLDLMFKDRPTSFIYSKKTGNYYYGSGYQGTLKVWGYIGNVATFGNNFFAIIEASHFKVMEKRICEEGDDEIIEEYYKAFQKISKNSNPILISIEYNTF